MENSVYEYIYINKRMNTNIDLNKINNPKYLFVSAVLNHSIHSLLCEYLEKHNFGKEYKDCVVYLMIYNSTEYINKIDPNVHNHDELIHYIISKRGLPNYIHEHFAKNKYDINRYRYDILVYYTKHRYGDMPYKNIYYTETEQKHIKEWGLINYICGMDNIRKAKKNVNVNMVYIFSYVATYGEKKELMKMHKTIGIITYNNILYCANNYSRTRKDTCFWPCIEYAIFNCKYGNEELKSDIYNAYENNDFHYLHTVEHTPDYKCVQLASVYLLPNQDKLKYLIDNYVPSNDINDNIYAKIGTYKIIPTKNIKYNINNKIKLNDGLLSFSNLYGLINATITVRKWYYQVCKCDHISDFILYKPNRTIKIEDIDKIYIVCGYVILSHLDISYIGCYVNLGNFLTYILDTYT